MKRANQIEKDKRIDLAVDMLLKGQTRQTVVAQFVSKYGIVDREVDRYIQWAKLRIAESAANDIDFRVSQALLRLDDLYYKNYKKADYRECRGVQDSLSKLLGMNAPEKVDMNTKVSVADTDISKLTPEQKAALLALNRIRK